jgi:hypothetical protein
MRIADWALRIAARLRRHPLLPLILAMLLPGCGEESPEPPRVVSVERGAMFLRVQLSAPLDLVRVERLDSAGRPSQAWTFTSGPRSDLRLEPAPPAGRHRLRLTEANRQAHLLEVHSPDPPVSGIRAKLELPLGVPDAEREVWLPVGAPALLSLLIERDSSEPLAVEIRLAFPQGLQAKGATENGWAERDEGETRVLIRSAKLRDREQFLLTVLPTSAGRSSTVFATIVPSGAPAIEVQAHVRGADVEEVRRLVGVSETRLPTDRFGEFDATRRTDVLQLPTRFGQFLRETIGGMPATAGGEEPFSFQSARLANRSETAVAVELRGWVCATDSPQPCLDFAPPIVLGKTAPFVSAPALLPPESETWVTLPVFVQPETLPGDYRRDFEIRLLGTEAVLTTLSVPLRVERTDRPAFFIALLATLVTVLALPVLALRGSKLLSRFTAAELIQIALFGSAVFLLVGVPSRLLATLLNALLPVFSPFILGLYGQVMALAILGALVVLVPRPGVVLLAGLTRFLLNGVFFGAFSPVDFLYVIPMLLVGEVCLWVVGVTRHPDAPVSALQLAPACALMGVVAAGLQLSLEMSLFRLFFADWYIALFLLLDGALYPALGAALGAQLGATLKRTAE